MDIAILCLMIKHFSRHVIDEVIVPKIDAHFMEILMELNLDHFILIDSKSNDYRLIFGIGPHDGRTSKNIHPMGAWFHLSETELSPLLFN